MVPFLNRDSFLEGLEEAQQWGKTIAYCKTQWELVKSIDTTLRLMSQSWFLCSFIEQLPPYNGNPSSVNLDYSILTTALQDTLSYGESYCHCLPKYLCMSGYMMSTHPEWFVSKNQHYNMIKEKGNNNFIKAYELAPDICSLFYTQRKRRGTNEEARLLFPGYSEVDCFFKSVITENDGK